jgi:hypothetical protein
MLRRGPATSISTIDMSKRLMRSVGSLRTLKGYAEHFSRHCTDCHACVMVLKTPRLGQARLGLVNAEKPTSMPVAGSAEQKQVINDVRSTFTALSGRKKSLAHLIVRMS